MEHEATVVLEKGYLEKSREQTSATESTENPFTGGTGDEPKPTPEPARKETGARGVEGSETESQTEPPQNPLLKPGWFKRR